MPKNLRPVIVAQTKHTRGMFGSIANLANDVISPSIVAFPYYFSANVPMLLVFLVLYGLLSAYAAIILRKMCVSHQVYTLAEISLVALGRPGFLLATACVFIFNWGGSIASTLVVGNVGVKLLAEFCHYRVCDRTNFLLIAYAVAGPLAFFKSMGKFALISTISQLNQIMAITMLIVLVLVLASENHWRPLDPPHQGGGNLSFVPDLGVLGDLGRAHNGTSFTAYFTEVEPRALSAIGGLAYMYTCHDMALHVLTSLKDATARRWRIVACVVPVVFMVFCLLIGLLGLLFVGPSQNLLGSIAFKHGSPGHYAVLVARACMSIACIVNIPFNQFMPRVAVMGLLQILMPHWTIKNSEPGNRTRRNIVHVTVTTLLLVSSCLVAIFVTQLGTFVSIIGISGIFIAQLLPAICYLRLRQPHDIAFHLHCSRAMVFVGLCSVVMIIVGVATDRSDN